MTSTQAKRTSTPCRSESRARRRLVLLSVLVPLLTATPALAAPRVVGAELSKRIDADVDRVMRRADVPGAVVLIVADGQVVYRRAYGQRDREQHLPADVDTHFEIGSITKQLTAAAILQLQEAGKVDVDAKLATYLPDAPHASEVTLRQLLTHTSGLPEYLEGPDIAVEATRPATFAQLMARIAGKPLGFAPGSRWSYCNTGYVLLGRVIEVVSHESYRHYQQAHFFDPLGMKQSFTVADEAHLPNLAQGYHHVNGRLERTLPIHDSVSWSAGNIVSTIDDLQRWSAALAGGKVISPQSYAAMTTPFMTTAQVSAEYGFGLFVDSLEGQPRIGHTGGAFGFTTANEYFPRQNLRIIAFTNNGDDRPEPGEVLTTAVFNQLFPEIAAAALRPADGEDTAATARARAAFALLQRGSGDYAGFAAKLSAKLGAGLAKRLAEQLGPLGAPEAFVFKGRRTTGGVRWLDYLLQFGPGSVLKIGLGIDDAGKVAALSIG
jgi:CubicO group peptidase (beta-lactamase class C family)